MIAADLRQGSASWGGRRSYDGTPSERRSSDSPNRRSPRRFSSKQSTAIIGQTAHRGNSEVATGCQLQSISSHRCVLWPDQPSAKFVAISGDSSAVTTSQSGLDDVKRKHPSLLFHYQVSLMAAVRAPACASRMRTHLPTWPVGEPSVG